MKRLYQLYFEGFIGIQRNIWVLAISMFVNRSGAMVLLFISLYITNDLHFGIEDAGMALSIYGIGSVFGSFAGGWLTDRFHFFQVMIGSLVVSGLLILLLLFTSKLWLVYAIVFGYAFTADIFRPANSAAIGIFSDADNRTRSVSLVRLAINLGFSVGPAIGGFIAFHAGYSWLFIVDTITSLGAAAMLYFYLPHDVAAHPKTRKSMPSSGSQISAYQDTTYLLFIFLVAAYGVCFFQIFASIPQYLSKVGKHNEDVIGLLMAFNGLIVVLIEMPLITQLQKQNRPFFYIIAGAVCVPLSFVFLLLGGQYILLATAYILVISFSEILAMPFMMNFSISRAGSSSLGQYTALYAMAWGISNILAPVAGLQVAARIGFDGMFLFIIFLSVIVVVGFWFLSKKLLRSSSF